MDLVKESQKQHYDFVMTEYGMGLQNWFFGFQTFLTPKIRDGTTR